MVYEYSIISQNLYDIGTDNSKFIPVLRSGELGESSPAYISGLIAHFMRDDLQFDSDLFELTRIIYDNPKIKKPELGPIPNFDKDELEVDPVIEKATKFSKQLELEKKKQDYLTQKGLNDANNQFNLLLNQLSEKARFYTQATKFRFSLVHSRTTDYYDVNDPPCGTLAGEGIYFYFHLDENTNIVVSRWNKPPKTSRSNHFNFPGEEPKQLGEADFYQFDINENFEPIWKDAKGVFLNIEDISKNYFTKIMDEIIKSKK